MMKSLVSLTFIYLLMIILTLSKSSAQEDLIAKTCRETPFYQLCVSTLQSDHNSHKAGIKGLGLIVIRAAKAKANTILNYIKKLVESKEQLKDPLNECTEFYSTIVSDHIPNVVEALSNGDMKSAKAVVSNAATGAKECHRSLSSILKKSADSGMSEDITETEEGEKSIVSESKISEEEVVTIGKVVYALLVVISFILQLLL